MSELEEQAEAESNERDEQKLLLEHAQVTHDLGLSLPTRTIFLTSASVNLEGEESGTDTQMADRLMKNLHVLEALSLSPVTVVMNNVGGDVYHGLAIFDALGMSQCALTAVVRGHAMSMGSVILQACGRRLMGKHATQMVHYGQSGFFGHSKTFAKWAEEENRVNLWMEGLYLKRIRERHPRFTLRRLRAMLAHDTFLDAEESVALGLADAIG